MIQRYIEALHKPRWELTPADQYVLSTGNLALIILACLLFLVGLCVFYYLQMVWQERQERKRVKRDCPRCKGSGVEESPSIGLRTCVCCSGKGYQMVKP